MSCSCGKYLACDGVVLYSMTLTTLFPLFKYLTGVSVIPNKSSYDCDHQFHIQSLTQYTSDLSTVGYFCRLKTITRYVFILDNHQCVRINMQHTAQNTCCSLRMLLHAFDSMCYDFSVFNMPYPVHVLHVILTCQP